MNKNINPSISIISNKKDMFVLKYRFTFLTTILFVLSVFYLGCSSATSENYSKICDTWVGHDINELLTRWGIPSNEYIMPNGSKMYSWLWVGNSYITSNYNYWLNSVQTTKTTWWCNTTFTVGTDGKIITWRYEGNNCKAEDPDKK